ncbi:GNAT family [Aspergillus sclerotialis]|uniref:GNAT family n=1 Tax=Aspergillus sclerotialis TaxID=2070753 RepID=A0A3A2ZNF1_9EURO|nr:GNAT family [Aspergillus sclerotialis]
MTYLFPNQVTRVIIPPEPECIQTKRLLLMAIQPADAPGIFTIRSHPEVAKFLWQKEPESDIQQTEKWIAGKTFATPDGSGALNRRFQFVIIRADDPAQRIIGTVGINSLIPAPSIGYALHPEFWGLGYSTEAVQGVMNAWWQLPRVKPNGQLNGPGDGKEMLYACCNSENAGSMKVLEKNGFRLYDKVALEGHIVAYWRRGCETESH